jgi:hypothetical protein
MIYNERIIVTFTKFLFRHFNSFSGTLKPFYSSVDHAHLRESEVVTLYVTSVPDFTWIRRNIAVSLLSKDIHRNKKEVNIFKISAARIFPLIFETFGRLFAFL